MAKKAYVRKSDNTEWVELASATTDLDEYLLQSSASTNYAPIVPTTQNGFRNKLINGGFDIWQRGAGPFNLTTTTYGADRFAGFRQGAVAGLTSTRVDSDLNGFRYFNRLQRTSGNTSTATNYFGASFESDAFSIPLRGKPLVFSFYARRGANYSGTSGTLLRLSWATGTGTDLPFAIATTGEVQTTSDFNLTTSWVRYQMVIPTVPSTTTATRYFFEWMPSGTAGANDFVDLTGLQLEEGSVATPFEQRPYGLELSLCQRYFVRLIDPSGSGVSNGGTANGASRVNVSLPVEMRVPPTSVTANGTFSFWDGTNAPSGTLAATSSFFPSRTSIEVEFDLTGAITAGKAVKMYTSNSTSKWLNVSAEL